MFPAYAKSVGSNAIEPAASTVGKEAEESTDPSDWFKNSSFTPILGKVVFDGEQREKSNDDDDTDDDGTPRKKRRKDDSGSDDGSGSKDNGKKKRDKEKFDLSDIDNDGKLSYYELGIMIHPNEAPQMGNVLVDVRINTNRAIFV